jgi:hypothetical protein
MKPLASSFIIIALILGCNPNSKQHETQDENAPKILVINIDSALKNISNTPIKCSEFIESIDFIPLETNPQSVLGNGMFGVKIMATPDYVYGDLKKFELTTGQYVNTIGKNRGRGPGEFVTLMDAATDIVDNRVFVSAEGDKVMVYDENDVFIKKIDITPGLTGIRYLGNNNIIAFRDGGLMGSNESPVEYQIYNLDDGHVVDSHEIIGMKELKVDERYYYGIGRNCYWYFENKVQYYESYTDSVYSIDQDGVRTPRFFIERSDYKPSLTEMANNEKFENNRSDKIEIRTFFETPRLLIFMFSQGIMGGGSYYAFFDKHSSTTTILPIIGAIENDIAKYTIGYIQNVQGTTYGIEYFNSGKYENDFISEMENIPQSEWTETAGKFYNIIKNSNFDDNGIICYYKFRK